MMADEAKHLTVHLTDQGVIGIAKARGTSAPYLTEDSLLTANQLDSGHETG